MCLKYPLSHSFLSRLWDLEKQEKQLDHYQQNSTSLEQWIDNARKRQDTLQTAKFTDIQTLMDHLNQQKARCPRFPSIAITRRPELLPF